MNKFRKLLTIIVLVQTICSCQVKAQALPREDKQLAQKVETILKQLTIEEKVGLCTGGDGAYKGIPRLNISPVGYCDGPRGPNGQVGTTAFPSGVLFGASWNSELVQKAGKVMGEETRALNRGMLLGPACNILRDPLGGRFFEYYTEDPFLNSVITVAQIKGIQSEGVAACLKHYCCNNRENNRNFYMSMVDDRTLHEIYLPAYKAAVKEADVWSVMTSANGVNKEFVSDSKKMLNDILKEKWGFSGFVITDWLQTRSVEKAAFAGLDVSMPGGDICGFGKPLLEAVKAGKVPEQVIDDKVRRVLRFYGRVGALDGIDLKKGATLNTKEHQAVALDMARDGIVLLKNDHQNLPYHADAIKKVLVTGPNADKRFCLVAMGGSSWVESPYEVTALQGIRKAIGTEKVQYMSSDDLGGFQLIPDQYIKTEDGKPGFRAQYYAKGKDDPVVTKTVPNVDFMWEMKSPEPSIKLEDFREARFDAEIMPPVDGKYTFRFISGGYSLVFDNEWGGAPMAIVDKDRGMGTVTATVDLKKGVPFHLCTTFSKQSGDAAFRIEWEMPENSENKPKWTELDRAAKEADAVIFVGGIDYSLDTEGRDRVSLTFPKAQEDLINHLAGVNSKLSVVLINGSPLELGGWRPNVPSILEAWYPGMEGGTAIADILFGKVNPSGRLPFTWPKKLEDVPCHKLATQTNDFVNYEEKLMVGYRYYDTKQVEPEFAFGYGLSYTDFTYKKMKLKKGKDHTVQGTVLVKNTGKRDGSEVVQIYVKPLAPSVDRPTHELKAFKKVFVKAGETVNVDFALDEEDFSYFNVNVNDWSFDAGKYEIQVCKNSREIVLSSKITM
ncbi:MAG: glycoside hydrolase family 3 C-terminal domain-containing protein [Bacteroidota bacterium]|nr:glycoside hydrolase family 3 C-terminal domain-containing protein [Bacteroidota bacterium]